MSVALRHWKCNSDEFRSQYLGLLVIFTLQGWGPEWYIFMITKVLLLLCMSLLFLMGIRKSCPMVSMYIFVRKKNSEEGDQWDELHSQSWQLILGPQLYSSFSFSTIFFKFTSPCLLSSSWWLDWWVVQPIYLYS